MSMSSSSGLVLDVGAAKKNQEIINCCCYLTSFYDKNTVVIKDFQAPVVRPLTVVRTLTAATY